MAEARTPQIAPSNVDALRGWDGDEGAYWAANADHFDRAIAAYDDRFLAAADVQDADRVLDVGCGTGKNTRDAARAAASGSALGVDLSSRMIELARRRAVEEGLQNVTFEQADAQIHPFQAEAFDVAISRTGAMFFGDMVAAFTNIGRALPPGGRLALLTWQPLPGNEWIREFRGASPRTRPPRSPAGCTQSLLPLRSRSGTHDPLGGGVQRHRAGRRERGDVVRQRRRRRVPIRPRAHGLDARRCRRRGTEARPGRGPVHHGRP
jgi:SAM-dependent methyltransferase